MSVTQIEVFVDFNIKDYMLLAVALAFILALGYGMATHERLNLCKAEYAALKAGTEAVANAQKVKNLEEINKREAITQKLTEDNVKLQNDLNSKYAEYKRKRVLNSPRSSAVPAIPQTPEAVVEQNGTGLNGAMDILEDTGILAILESRDKAIMQSNQCAAWLEEQLAVR